MNLVEFFTEKNRAKTLKDKFETECASRNYQFELVGKDSKNNDIFYCKKMLDASLPTVAILAGLHGDEPAGPYGILEFMKHYEPKLCNLFLMPLMNPHGFNREIRRDANQSDLNRQWDESSRSLVRKLKKIFKNAHFDVVMSLHEDDGANGFYIYGGRHFEKNNLKKIAGFLKKHVNPIEDGEIYGDPVYNGVVEDNNEDKPKHFKSLEFFFDKIGVPNLTVELPGKVKLDERIKIYSKFLTKMLSNIK